MAPLVVIVHDVLGYFLPKVPPEEQGYPETPELAMALREPFQTFARTLPGAPQPAGLRRPRGRR